MVGGSEFIRYCGSPIPMGFGEADQEKGVVIVEFSDMSPAVTSIPIPRFQELKALRGDWESITESIEEMKAERSSAWVEVVYEGDDIAGNLRERLDEAVEGSDIEILRIVNDRLRERVMGGAVPEESLDDMDVTEVFERCLQTYDVPEDQQEPLLGAYQEIVVSLSEADPMAD